MKGSNRKTGNKMATSHCRRVAGNDDGRLVSSGAVISAGQLTSTGLLAYAPTVNSIERFAYPTHPLVSGRLTVRPHASMPTRILGGLADSQYTVQAPSKYTGKMCQLVQLILGYGEGDEDLGAAGAVVGINNPQAMADEFLKLLNDPENWCRARMAAINRVKLFYTQERMFESYRQIYGKGLD